MIKKILMPKVSDVMENGTIVSWLKKEGDFVEKGEILLEIEVEKTSVEIDAEESGYLRKILVREGETVPIGTVLAYLTDSMDESLGEETETKEKVEKKEEKEEENIIPLSSIRKVTAETLLKSKRDIPHFYVFVDIDMTEAVNFKGKYPDIKFDDIFVKASAKALEEFPLLNSKLDDDKIEIFPKIDIGIAVSLGKEGLVVPVIKNADKKSLEEIAKERKELVQKAREGKLALGDISGGTFTVDNVGVFGVDAALAIINPPEVAILSFGVIKRSPCVVDKKIEIRNIMKVTISADHRVVDGFIASQFLEKVKDILGSPKELL